MLKRILFVLMLSSSVTAFAGNVHSNCAQALPDYDPGFCPSFKSVAECHCVEAGMPRSMCQNMEEIYKRMIDVFGSVETACRLQTHTSYQVCVDDWKCYREGGNDSAGRACSGTGKKCE